MAIELPGAKTGLQALLGPMGEGLNQLGQYKLQHMLQQQKEGSGIRQSLAHGLAERGGSMSDILRTINAVPQAQPTGFLDILKQISPIGRAISSFGTPQAPQEAVSPEGQKSLGDVVIPEKPEIAIKKSKLNLEIASPYLKKLETLYEPYKSLHDEASRGLELLKTGKTAAGGKGFAAGKAPQFLSGDETQELMSIYDGIVVDLTAAKGAGRQTKALLQLVEKAKANIGQSRKVQEKRLNQVIKQAEPILNQYRAKTDVLKKYGGVPENYEAKIKDLAEEYGKKEKVFEELPDPTLYADKKIEDDETGQILISDGKQWLPEE